MSDNEVLSIIFKGFYKVDTVENSTSSPAINLFRMPCKDLSTIEILSCELFKLLKLNSKKLMIACSHLLHPRWSLAQTMISQGNSLVANKRKRITINKLIDYDVRNDEAQMIDLKIEHWLWQTLNIMINFNHAINNGYCTQNPTK